MAVRAGAGMRALVLAATVLVAGGLAQAHGRDHDAARRAVKAGEIRPLMDILNEIRSTVPGEIIGVEIEQKNGRWLYEFRAIDGKGRLFEIHVDGRSGEIEGVKEK